MMIATATAPSCPTPPTVGQLQARIKETAKAMKTCEAAAARAGAKETDVQVRLYKAQAVRVAAHAKLIGKAFTLGGDLVALKKEMGATKGKHRGDTFRKTAIKLLGNKNAVYRPMAIYRYLTNTHAIASEAAAVKYAEDNDEFYRNLAEEAQRVLRDGEENERPATAPTPTPAKEKVTAPQATRHAKRKPAKPKLTLVGGTDSEAESGEHDDEDGYVPLTAAELKVQTEAWFCCFSPDLDSDEAEPQAIPAAILFAIDNFYPDGLDAAIAWLKGVQAERKPKVPMALKGNKADDDDLPEEPIE